MTNSYFINRSSINDSGYTAVKLLKNQEELRAFLEMMFRTDLPLLEKEREILNSRHKKEFPTKN